MAWYDGLAVELAPIGMVIGANRLRNRDANDTGTDDAVANVLRDMSPIAGELFSGKDPGQNATDKAFLALYLTARTYLESRGKLPGQTAQQQLTGAPPQS